MAPVVVVPDLAEVEEDDHQDGDHDDEERGVEEDEAQAGE